MHLEWCENRTSQHQNKSSILTLSLRKSKFLYSSTIPTSACKAVRGHTLRENTEGEEAAKNARNEAYGGPTREGGAANSFLSFHFTNLRDDYTVKCSHSCDTCAGAVHCACVSHSKEKEREREKEKKCLSEDWCFGVLG